MRSPNTRDEALEAALSPGRRTAIEREQDAFIDFCCRLGLPLSAEALTLHLAALLTQGTTTGHGITTRLERLDAARRLSGEEPWSADPSVHAFLRGMHRSAPRGLTPRADPLYKEHVHALVDIAMAPEYEQVRARAVVLCANETLWSCAALTQLEWRHLRFFANRVEIHVPSRPPWNAPGQDPYVITGRGDDLCVVTALRNLQHATNAGNLPVFGSEAGYCDRHIVEALMALLPHQVGSCPRNRTRFRTGGAPLRRILARATAPQPRQLRDRALLLMGFGAALTDLEAIRLRRSQVQLTSQGLVLQVEGRRLPTGIPRGQMTEYDPTAAWIAWLDLSTPTGSGGPSAPAFLHVRGTTIRAEPMTPTALNNMIRRRTDEAALLGQYTFTSLRSGFIRSAIRAGAPGHVIASHVDFRSLRHLQRYERREQLIRTSVAGQIGL